MTKVSTLGSDDTGTGAIVRATSPVLVTPALGTPTSGVLTSCTGLPIAGGGTGVTALPSFAVTGSGNQNISSSTYTKIQFQTEKFDTNNNFDSSTNYRFTPTIAGKYIITGSALLNTGATGATSYRLLKIYKNGSSNEAVAYHRSATVFDEGPFIAAVIHLNGSTDYVELYTYQDSGGTVVLDGVQSTFTGAWVGN